MPEQDELIKTIKFEILFEIGREGDLYWATCMGLTGEGDTMEEALHWAKLHLEWWISELLKNGLPIPIGVGATDNRISAVDKIRANFSKREKIVIEIALDGRPLS